MDAYELVGSWHLESFCGEAGNEQKALFYLHGDTLTVTTPECYEGRIATLVYRREPRVVAVE